MMFKSGTLGTARGRPGAGHEQAAIDQTVNNFRAGEYIIGVMPASDIAAGDEVKQGLCGSYAGAHTVKYEKGGNE